MEQELQHGKLLSQELQSIQEALESKKAVDTLLEVEAAAKALLAKKLQERYRQILQEQFLLELQQCPTDEEDETSDDSDLDMIEQGDTITDLTDADMEMDE